MLDSGRRYFHYHASSHLEIQGRDFSQPGEHVVKHEGYEGYRQEDRTTSASARVGWYFGFHEFLKLYVLIHSLKGIVIFFNKDKQGHRQQFLNPRHVCSCRVGQAARLASVLLKFHLVVKNVMLALLASYLCG